ncbi:MAG: VWA domain-containing protein [Pyrinomonadaceae bacterium]
MTRLSSVVLALVVLLAGLPVAGSRAQTPRRGVRAGTHQGAVKICRGITIPDGYTVVAETTSPECPGGAFVIKKEGVDSAAAPQSTPPATKAAAPPPATSASPASRATGKIAGGTGGPPQRGSSGPPVLAGATPTIPAASKPQPDASVLNSAPLEVDDGDVVRVETNLVTVPVSVFDRQGRVVTNLRQQDFRIFEDGVEQEVAYFEPTEKPFTVALLLDTSSSTRFRLSDIQEAAIDFARQLQPQDRMLVVTFDDEVLLLTEATNDQSVISGVIRYNARTGGRTRLYDAVDLVIKERLNKIKGRKAIVLFTDGLDTASYMATYEDTLRSIEELDVLVYPLQYDTYADQNAVTSRVVTIQPPGYGGWYPGSSRSSRVIYGSPSGGLGSSGLTRADYERAGSYLSQLAEKTGGRLYNADDPRQLARAFSLIAEELRRQYSLGYYPKTPPAGAGERRQIKVRVKRPDLAVRARDGYVSTAAGGSR